MALGRTCDIFTIVQLSRALSWCYRYSCTYIYLVVAWYYCFQLPESYIVIHHFTYDVGSMHQAFIQYWLDFSMPKIHLFCYHLFLSPTRPLSNPTYCYWLSGQIVYVMYQYLRIYVHVASTKNPNDRFHVIHVAMLKTWFSTFTQPLTLCDNA